MTKKSVTVKCMIVGFHDTMMNTVFWDLTPCNHLELTDVSKERTALFGPDDEGSTFLRNIDKILSNYTVSRLGK
jgi:hypothetical protein